VPRCRTRRTNNNSPLISSGAKPWDDVVPRHVIIIVTTTTTNPAVTYIVCFSGEVRNNQIDAYTNTVLNRYYCGNPRRDNNHVNHSHGIVEAKRLEILGKYNKELALLHRQRGETWSTRESSSSHPKTGKH